MVMEVTYYAPRGCSGVQSTRYATMHIEATVGAPGPSFICDQLYFNQMTEYHCM